MGKLKDTIDAALSFGKTLVLSRRPSAAGKPKDARLIIMGNGPSLRDTIASYSNLLRNSDTLAVNFAANADAYRDIRPKMYVLADPHFFRTEADGKSADPNVVRLWKNIADTDWPMTLYVPCNATLPESILKNGNIAVRSYNLTPGEGLAGPVHWLYRHGLAMPRPRNVLIASIMVALREGYRDIALVGADHTWSRDLWVDGKNRVISVQKHFYEDNDKELDRVAREYAGYHLHDILNSLTVAFRSYHQIAAYAKSIGATITNCTPGSYIDAFPRAEIPETR